MNDYTNLRAFIESIKKNGAKLEDKIEALAQLMNQYPELRYNREKKVPEHIYNFYHNTLARFALWHKGLKNFSGFGNTIGKTLVENSFEYQNYEGIELLKCYDYAKDRYGIMDDNTGEVVPFMVWFNSVHKRKRYDIMREKQLEENQYDYRMKQYRYRDVVRRAYAEAGLSYGKGLGYLNPDKVEEELNKRKAASHYYEELNIIAGETHCVSYDNQEEDNGGINFFEAIPALSRHSNSLMAIDRMCGLFEALHSAAKTSSLNLYKDALAVVVIRSYYCREQLSYETRLMLEQYGDPELLKYLEEQAPKLPSDSDKWLVDLYATFLGLAKETIRKRVQAANHYLLSLQNA